MKLRITALILLLVVAFFTCAQTQAADTFSNGSGYFTYTDKKGSLDKPIRVWYYKPAKLSNTSPIVFVMHGTDRDAWRYRDDWAKYAEQYGCLLIVPECSKESYPGSTYHYGNMFDKHGRPNPEGKWIFTTIEHLFDYVRSISGNRNTDYYIYGHSAGGQFVHRMVLCKPDARIRMAIAANAGVWAMPQFTDKFPYGLKGTVVTPNGLKTSFAKDLIVLLGEKDTLQDKHLPTEREAMAEGKNRFERGNKFYRTGKQQAAKLGARFNWKLKTVPNVGHSDAGMAGTAAELLLGKR